MRSKLILPSIVLMVLVTGCASSNNAPSTPASPTGSASPDAGSGAVPSQFVGVHYEHNYSAAPESKTFDIPANAGAMTIRLYYTGATAPGGTTVCVTGQQDADEILVSPGNMTFAENKYDANGVVGGSGGGHCSSDKVQAGTMMAGGTWTIRFSGGASGALTGVIDITKQS